MPLKYANIGEDNTVKRIGGNAEMKKHLADLGFAVGSTVKIIASRGGDMIVNVRDARIAISRELAGRIMI